jgi:hypothetical protein
MRKPFDVFHPYNLGNEKYKLTIRINSQFTSLYNAGDISGRAVKIALDVGQGRIEMIPNKANQLGLWVKGRPADIVFERVPPELRIIDINHIDKILVEVNFM